MISISEYLNENLDEFVFELKNQTYLNAAKKAKKLGDPRAEKFLQAFKDNIDKELMNEDPDDEEKKFNIYYNADKKSIVRLKGLSKNKWNNKASLRNFGIGTALEIINDDLRFVANVYVASNKDEDRQIFLRQSIISQDKWKYVSKEFNRVAEKINDSEAKKAFTFIRMFTNTGAVEFFYIIDTDKLIPIYLRHSKNEHYEDDECLDNYSEDDKTAINAICKAMNQNHKDIYIIRSLACMLLEKKCDTPTKMDPKDNENVLELNEMIDVWRLVDKYDIRWYTDYKKYPESIFVNKEDWESAKSKANSTKVFDACLKRNGRMKGHEGPISGTN